MTLLTEMPFLEDFATAGEGDLDADMNAFAAASAWLQDQGGGGLQLRQGRTYLVGRQTLAGTVSGGGAPGDYAWAPEPILRVFGATKPVIIEGNGACIKAVDGLRFGSFDSTTGEPISPSTPYFVEAERGTPYIAMIELFECTGGYSIRNLELDGNSPELILGGDWGDFDRQIHASGIWAEDCTGPIHISNVYTHHHGLDGYLMRHANGPGGGAVLGLRSEHNGRQGLSLSGGRDLEFAGCRFAFTGRGVAADALSTAPKAGVDIEPDDDRIVRNVTFSACRFECNNGVAMLADVGDMDDVHFENCLMVGDKAPSLWPNRPGLSFKKCIFAGQTVIFYPDPTRLKSGLFEDCLFTDDRSYSDTGLVFGSDSDPGAHYMLDLGVVDSGARFIRCTVTCVNDGLGVYATTDVVSQLFQDLRVDVDSTTAFAVILRGEFRGVNAITAGGTVAFANETIRYGTVTINGTRQYYGTATWNPGSITGAAPATTTVTVPGAAVGDIVRLSADIVLGGLVLTGEATAANTVTVRLSNPDSDAAGVDLASMIVTAKIEKAAA